MAKTKFIVHIFLSLTLLVSFVVFTINDFLTVGNSYFFLCCYGLPFIFAILLALLSIPFLSMSSSTFRFLPITINIATVIIGIALFQYKDQNPDLGFQHNFQHYSEAAHQIEIGILRVYKDGFVSLPQDLKDVSITGEAYVIQNDNVTTIYFMSDRESFDGYSWGYLYRSDGSEPTPNNKFQDCTKSRQVIPSIPKWFYCEVNRIWLSANDK